jgi:hypothetical protein
MSKNPDPVKGFIDLLIDLETKLDLEVTNSIYAKDDIRVSVFAICLDQIKDAIIFLNMVRALHLQSISLNDIENIFGIHSKSGQLTTNELRNVRIMLEQYIRFSIIILIHFQIENYVKIILSKFTANIPIQFTKSARLLLDNIKSLNNKKEKIEILEIFSYLRNCFHSDGVHTKESVTKSIGSIKFEFKKGERIDWASWNNIKLILNETFNIVQEINKSPEIQKFSEKINNLYFPK